MEQSEHTTIRQLLSCLSPSVPDNLITLWNKLTLEDRKELFDVILLEYLLGYQTTNKPNRSITESFSNILKLSLHTEAYDEKLIGHIIDRLSNCILAPLTHQPFTIQTKLSAHTFHKLVPSVITHYALFLNQFLLIPQNTTDEVRLQQQGTIISAFAKVISFIGKIEDYPFRVALNGFAETMDTELSMPKTHTKRTNWIAVGPTLLKTVMDSCMDAAKALAVLDDDKMNMLTTLVHFMVLLAREQATTAIIDPLCTEVSEGISKILITLLDDAEEYAELPPNFFSNFNKLLEKWCGLYGTTVKSAVEILIKFWKVADAKKEVTAPKSSYHGVDLFVLNPDYDSTEHAISMLRIAKEYLTKPETTGQGLLILFWYWERHSSIEAWDRVLGVGYLNLLIQYVQTTAPSQNENEEDFKFHKKIAIRAILSLFDACKRNPPLDGQLVQKLGQTAYDQAWKALASQISDPTYTVLILDNWEADPSTADEEIGCFNPEVVHEIIKQIVMALHKIIQGGGTYKIPNGSFCTSLYKYFMKRLKSMSDEAFARYAAHHFGIFLLQLTMLYSPDLKITSAVVPLKQLAVKELLKSVKGAKSIDKETPFLLDYATDVWNMDDELKDGVGEILLENLSFVTKKLIKMGAPIQTSEYCEYMCMFLPMVLPRHETCFSCVVAVGDILPVLDETQAIAVIKSGWHLIQATILSTQWNDGAFLGGLEVIVSHWKKGFSVFPFLDRITEALRSPHTNTYALTTTLVKLCNKLSTDPEDNGQLLADFRMKWIDTLEHLLKYTTDVDIMMAYLGLFQKLFKDRQHDFVKGADVNWSLAQDRAIKLFEMLMSEESLVVKMEAISDTLKVIPQSRKRRRDDEPSNQHE